MKWNLTERINTYNIDSGLHPVADISKEYVNAEYYARLIASAPELLEACGVALMRLKSGTKKENEFNKNVANLLEQAINKSKGN